MHRYAVFLSALLLLPVFAAADTVTAEWDLETPGNSFASFGGPSLVSARGQSFLAGTGGKVISSAFRIARTTDHAIDLRVSVYPADANGLPTGDPIVTDVFPASSMAAGGAGTATVFAFSTESQALEAGGRYVLVAESAEAGGDGALYFLNGKSAAAATYADGAACSRISSNWESSTTDFSFQVIVDETTPVEVRTWGGVKAGF